MNTFVSGESDAKGLSVILPYIAVDPAAVAIRRPEHLGTLGIWLGRAGEARRGMARLEQGKDFGAAGLRRARLSGARHGQAWQGKELGLA